MDEMKRRDWRCWFLVLLWLVPFGCSEIPRQKGQKAEKMVTLTIPNHPLRNEQDLDILLQEIGDARVVLLGEASHGTSAYYTWRAAISKRLIQEKGFDFIAVEGEWAEPYRVNEFIKGGQKDSAEALASLENYNRWPTWMWGNYEVAFLYIDTTHALHPIQSITVRNEPPDLYPSGT